MSRADALRTLIDRMPYARFLGMECDVRGDEMTAILPFKAQNIGNAALPALHGGAIGSFLEIAAMAQVFLLTEGETLPKTIDLTVDYLRSAADADLYARTTIKKLGRRVVSVYAEAWQAERAKPVAGVHANFLVAD